MASMTLAVMTRAILGHSGRALTADGATTAIYALVFLAAVVRVIAALVDDATMVLLWVSAVAWLAAFALFSVHYGRVLVRR